MKRKLLIFVLGLLFTSAFAQYPPAAGQEGSTAIHKNDVAFIDWAATCQVERGYMDISQPDNGFASYGEDVDGTEEPGVNGVVSLGDGGAALLTFNTPLANGDGWDFAVFENAFDDFFLELAFVEVSSDGENFFRFPCVSLTQSEVQIEGFGQLDPTEIHNFAGKYRVDYGTPFDLEELKNEDGLDVNAITHVKLIDVVGCIQSQYARYDSESNIINDPWSTPFESGGFDLDAVGIIHNQTNVYVEEVENHNVIFYPNPSKELLYVKASNVDRFELRSLNGELLLLVDGSQAKIIDVSFFSKGVYLGVIYSSSEVFIEKLVIL